jgi:hypothetical protein
VNLGGEIVAEAEHEGRSLVSIHCAQAGASGEGAALLCGTLSGAAASGLAG